MLFALCSFEVTFLYSIRLRTFPSADASWSRLCSVILYKDGRTVPGNMWSKEAPYVTPVRTLRFSSTYVFSGGMYTAS